MIIEARDWVVVLATVLGPILAVQTQKWIENSKEKHLRKLRVFTQLMATRGTRLSSKHVQAINMIDLVFYGESTLGLHRRSRKEQAVSNAWKEYHDNLSEVADFAQAQQEAHFAQRNELFINMLYAISQDVRFVFDRVQLKRGAYTPVAHKEIEADQHALRKVLLKTFSGDTPLGVSVSQLPSNPGLVEEYRRNVARIADALEANHLAVSSALSNTQ